MTSIVELAKVITPENRAEVLPRFFHCSRRDAREIAAEVRPQTAPPRRELVTAVRSEPMRELLPSGAPAVGEERGVDTNFRGLVQLANLTDANARPAPQKSSQVEPLTADLRRLHLTVSRKFLEKLSAARDALSHSKPGASTEEILEAGLDLVLAAHAKKKGLVEKPLAKPRASKQGRYIPAHVRREVWKRDGGRCQWRFESGEICGSTLRVECDHIEPVALGGVATVEGCRLLCRAHNNLAARRVFGDALMDGVARKRKADRVREPETQYPMAEAAHPLASASPSGVGWRKAVMPHPGAFHAIRPMVARDRLRSGGTPLRV